MKRNSVRMALQRAMQMTQFDGLKVLSKESILQASKEKREEASSVAPAPLIDSKSGCENNNNNDEETIVAKFLSDVG